MANQRRSVSWFSLSSVRGPATAPPPAQTPTVTVARSDSIRPPAFKPFRLPAAQPQTASATAAAAQRAQPPPAPTHVQPPVRPQFKPTSLAVSNAKAPTTTAPAPPKSQPLATSPITTKLSSPAHTPKPSTILPLSITSSVPTSPEIKSPPAAYVSANVVLVPAAAETEHKGVLVQQLTEKSNLVPPNYTTLSHVETKHHKLQSTAQNAKAGVAIQDKGVAMQRKYLESKKYGTRVVRLVGDNIGAVMVLNSSRKKHDYGAKPLSIQDKRSTSTLFMNSNVQEVNNSIAFDSCLTHHDSGLHVSTFEP